MTAVDRIPPTPHSASRLATVLTAVLTVIACGVALKVTEPGPDYELVDGGIGEPVVLDGAMVTVGPPRFGDRFHAQYGEEYATPGMFVVVRVTVAATERLKVTINSARLTAGERSYGLVEDLGMTVPPGFQLAEDVCFEVDPTRVQGLTIEVWDAEIVHGFGERAEVPLGVTAESAAQLAVGRHGRAVEAQPSAKRALR